MASGTVTHELVLRP